MCACGRPLATAPGSGTGGCGKHTHFNGKQQSLLNFVLAHYVSEKVEELDPEKLAQLLQLKKQNSIAAPSLTSAVPKRSAACSPGFGSICIKTVRVTLHD